MLPVPSVRWQHVDQTGKVARLVFGSAVVQHFAGTRVGYTEGRSEVRQARAVGYLNLAALSGFPSFELQQGARCDCRAIPRSFGLPRIGSHDSHLGVHSRAVVDSPSNVEGRLHHALKMRMALSEQEPIAIGSIMQHALMNKKDLIPLELQQSERRMLRIRLEPGSSCHPRGQLRRKRRKVPKSHVHLVRD